MDDMDALFANSDFVNSLVEEARTENQQLAKIEPKSEVDIKNLQEHILEKGTSMLEKAKDAVEEVLICVQSEPTNGEVVGAASGILRSYTGLLSELSKLNSLNQKFKQQKELMQMKIESEQSMNQVDNATALMMKREEILAAIVKANGSGTSKKNVIESD